MQTRPAKNWLARKTRPDARAAASILLTTE
jgi:hypothetical protein